MSIPDAFINAVVNLAMQLSAEQMAALLKALRIHGSPSSDSVRQRILGTVPLQPFAVAVALFLDRWQYDASDLPADVVISLLQTASLTAGRVRGQQQVRLVWTGPETRSIPMRRTEEALLEAIDAARTELLVVSFAVYKARAIMQALEAALDRGVRLRICLEAPEPSDGRMGYDTLAALGAVGRRAQVYIWPRDQRPLGPYGKPGSLHAKIAVADADHLFISSANLTDYAMHLNMEMGVVIRGGPLPGRVREHFLELIRSGVLVRADS